VVEEASAEVVEPAAVVAVVDVVPAVGVAAVAAANRAGRGPLDSPHPVFKEGPEPVTPARVP
jgi:hypothetical protein